MILKAIRGNIQYALKVKQFLSECNADLYSLDSYDYGDASKIYLVDPFNNYMVLALPEYDHRCGCLAIYYIDDKGDLICESDLPDNVVNPTIRDIRIILVNRFADEARDIERSNPGFRDHYNLDSFKRINIFDDLLKSIYGNLVVDKNTLYYIKS